MMATTCLVGALGMALLFRGICLERTRNRQPSFIRAADRLAAEAGYRRLGGWGLIGVSGVSSVAGWLLAAGVTGSIWLAPVGAAVAWPCPFARARARRQARRSASSRAWPDALASIISGIRAGLSLQECCCELEGKGPIELRSGFRVLAITYRATGSFVAGLARLQSELEDPIADRVSMVLRMAHEVGGSDLVRVLQTSAELIREDIQIRGEVVARWSWTVWGARVAVASPFLVLMVMSARPEAQAAYRTGIGTMTILVGSLLTFAGYRLMLRAARLPEETRVR